MARNNRRDPSITQKNDASCMGTRFQRGKRAKTNSNKRDRQILQKDLNKRIEESEIIENPPIDDWDWEDEVWAEY